MLLAINLTNDDEYKSCFLLPWIFYDLALDLSVLHAFA